MVTSIHPWTDRSVSMDRIDAAGCMCMHAASSTSSCCLLLLECSHAVVLHASYPIQHAAPACDATRLAHVARTTYVHACPANGHIKSPCAHMTVCVHLLHTPTTYIYVVHARTHVRTRAPPATCACIHALHRVRTSVTTGPDRSITPAARYC